MIIWLKGKALKMTTKADKLFVKGLSQFDIKTRKEVELLIKEAKPELISMIKSGFEDARADRKYCNDSMPCIFLQGNKCTKTGQEVDFNHSCPLAKSRFYTFFKYHNNK